MTKIMLVEDDKSLREIYGIRLEAEGYEIVSAGDGEEGLALAISEKPDLILSDIMMPKISGFDMLDIIRSTPETKDMKVIMMTALSSEEQRSRGEQLGANKYLVKSQVGIEDVVRSIKEVLASNEKPVEHDMPTTPSTTSAEELLKTVDSAQTIQSPSQQASPIQSTQIPADPLQTYSIPVSSPNSNEVSQPDTPLSDPASNDSTDLSTPS